MEFRERQERASAEMDKVSARGGTRKLVGVAAGAVVPGNVRRYAQKHGFCA
jgi:hypothetical protein